MANMKYRVTDDRDGWMVVDPVTEATLATFILPDDAETLKNLLLVGAKSTFHDGGAADKGTPIADRIAMMRKRWAAVVNGEWRFNDGRGGTKSKFPDPLLFRACLAVGAFGTNTESAARAAWAKSTDVGRSKAYKNPAVVEWLAAHADQSADDDPLDAILE